MVQFLDIYGAPHTNELQMQHNMNIFKCGLIFSLPRYINLDGCTSILENKCKMQNLDIIPTWLWSGWKRAKICRSLEINKAHRLRSVTMKLQCAGLLLWGGSSVLVQSIGIWSAVLLWISRRRTADPDCAPLIYCQASSGCQRIYKAPMRMWQGRTLYTSSVQHIAVSSRNWLFFSY